MPEAALVTMTGMAKRFGGVAACAGIDLRIASGEVHALLGENGAGEFTLMNVLSGVITDNDGEITVAAAEDNSKRVSDVENFIHSR